MRYRNPQVNIQILAKILVFGGGPSKVPPDFPPNFGEISKISLKTRQTAFTNVVPRLELRRSSALEMK